MDAVLCGDVGDQAGQESRSDRHRAAASVIAMDLTVHASFLPHTDPDASLAFYRDTLGFQVRNDIGYRGMRWITVGPPDQPGTSIHTQPGGRPNDPPAAGQVHSNTSFIGVGRSSKGRSEHEANAKEEAMPKR
jgi:hypothetical protein